jgi:hypothetical protein
MRLSLPVLGLLAAGCVRHHIVLSSPPATPHAGDLHVTCALEGDVADALPVDGTDSDLVGSRRTLEAVVSTELASWAEHHPHRGGWDLSLELFRAQARDNTVELSVRASLSSAIGEENASQTRRDCKETADAPDAAFYACVQSLAHDLKGWIEGVKP